MYNFCVIFIIDFFQLPEETTISKFKLIESLLLNVCKNVIV